MSPAIKGNVSGNKRPIWLVYFPRTGHHLFMRMFSGHDELDMLEVFRHIGPATDPVAQISEHAVLDNETDACKHAKKQLRQGWSEWQEEVQQRQSDGKRVVESYSVSWAISPVVHNSYLNEKLRRRSTTTPPTDSSSPSLKAFWNLEPGTFSDDNPTVFSDEFLLSHVPLLLIRHPILGFPSATRAAGFWFDHHEGLHLVHMNFLLRYRWHRLIYDWYEKRYQQGEGPQPLVLDMDDLMYNPSAVAELCRRLGLDPKNTRYQWDKTAVHATYAKEAAVQGALAASTSINRGKGSAGVKMEDEVPKWREEFGEERAALLKTLVEDAMDDYLYLRERSIGR